MKVMVGVAIGVLVGVGGTVLVPRAGVEPVAALASPPGNGDCNADGSINLADVIWLLKYIFVPGSQAPEPIVCPPGGLPATGQTECYDASGVEIDCASEDYPGQDGYYQVGCPTEDRFVDNGDGTVTDNCTGLMWQHETAPGTYTWQQALQYCETLELAGHTDWRLPNVRELQSIVDYGTWGPAIDTRFFSAEWSWYWSSSTSVADPNVAWHIVFWLGFVNHLDKDGASHVRAVRGRP